MRAKLEILAMVLGFLGLFGTVAITAMPMWRVTAYIGANLIVMETMWEGLWMNCIRQADIRMQCKVYDSLLILPGDLQAGRALTCLSICLAAVALFVAIFGLRITSCCRDDPKSKNATLAAAGSLFLLACVTTLIPVCWTAHTVIRDFYNPLVLEAQKRELGAALYVGWATAGVHLATGVIMLHRCGSRKKKEEGLYYTETYVPANAADPGEDVVDLNRATRNSSLYEKHHYV